MDPRDALDLTFRMFRLNATQLGEQVGLNKSEMSRFRHKKQDISATTFSKLLKALPEDAFTFYWGLIRDENKIFRVSENGAVYNIDLKRLVA